MIPPLDFGCPVCWHRTRARHQFTLEAGATVFLMVCVRCWIPGGDDRSAAIVKLHDAPIPGEPSGHLEAALEAAGLA